MARKVRGSVRVGVRVRVSVGAGMMGTSRRTSTVYCRLSARIILPRTNNPRIFAPSPPRPVHFIPPCVPPPAPSRMLPSFLTHTPPQPALLPLHTHPRTGLEARALHPTTIRPRYYSPNSPIYIHVVKNQRTNACAHTHTHAHAHAHTHTHTHTHTGPEPRPLFTANALPRQPLHPTTI